MSHNIFHLCKQLNYYKNNRHNNRIYWHEHSNVLWRCELRALLLKRKLQDHSGQNLHHLLQTDVVGIPEGQQKFPKMWWTRNHTVGSSERFLLTWANWSRVQGCRSLYFLPNLSVEFLAPQPEKLNIKNNKKKKDVNELIILKFICGRHFKKKKNSAIVIPPTCWCETAILDPKWH